MTDVDHAFPHAADSPRRSFHSLQLLGGEELQIRFKDPYSPGMVSAGIAHIELTGSSALIEACGRAIVLVIDETRRTCARTPELRKEQSLWWYPRYGHVGTIGAPASTNRQYDISAFPVGAIGGLAVHGVHRFEIREGDDVAVTHMLDPTHEDTYTIVKVHDLRISGRASTLRSFGAQLADLTAATMADSDGTLGDWQVGGAWRARSNPGEATKIRVGNSC